MTLAEFSLDQLYGSNLELFAVITGILCVGLITFENSHRALAWWNWPIGILTSGAYVYIFWDYELYFNSVLQLFYVVTGFYGAWAWKYGGEQKTELLVRKMKMGTVAGWAALCIVGAMLLAGSFDFLGVDSAAPFWDGFVVTMSLTAQFIMTRKYTQHWWFWMGVDIVGVFLFWSQGLYATSLLYFIYGCLVVRGMITWQKAYEKDKPITVTTGLYGVPENPPTPPNMYGPV